MPTNRRQNKRRGGARNHSTKAIVSAVRELIDVEETKIGGLRPLVRDIPRMHLKRNKIHTISKSFSGANLTGSNSVGIGGAIVFSLAAFNDASALTDIFDRYRIIHAIVDFVPQATALGAPPLYTVLDYDDAGVPPSTAFMNQYDNVEVTQAGQTVERVLTPCLALAAYSGGLFSSFANRSYQWVDAASSGVEHYGVKYYLPTVPSGLSVSYSVNITMVVQFRSIH